MISTCLLQFRANSLSPISLTALRVRAAEGSIPHRIGGGLFVGGVYEWGLHTRNHAYVYGVSCCFTNPHVSLEEYSMLTPTNMHTCTAFSRLPGFNTLHAYTACAAYTASAAYAAYAAYTAYIACAEYVAYATYTASATTRNAQPRIPSGQPRMLGDYEK